MAYRSSYSKLPPTSSRTSSMTASSAARSTFSPPPTGNTTSNNSGSNSNTSGRFFGGVGGNSRSYGAEETSNNKRTDSGISRNYQTTNREKTSNPSAPQQQQSAEPAKSRYASSPEKTRSTAYSMNRSNLYKLPVSSGNSWSSSNGYGTKSSSGSGSRTPSDHGPENNLFSTSYSRSLSRESEAAPKEAPASTTSVLPRPTSSYRPYNQRSSTSTSFQSPSSYTPRTYGRTASRDLSYASVLSSSTRSLDSRPLRPACLERSAPEPPVAVAATKTVETAEKSESEEDDESFSTDSDDEDEEDDDKKETPAQEFVISRGTSPSRPAVSCSSNSPSSSDYVSSPKPCQTRSSVVQQVTHEVQTDESTETTTSNRSTRRFLGYTGLGGNSPRVGSYADRYLSTNVTPSRYTSRTEEKQAVGAAVPKDVSPPTSTAKPPIIPAGIANKEYRKSALNVDLDDQQVSEFRKRQEEFREAQRRVKRQARKSSSASPAASTSRRGSTASLSSENNKMRSPVGVKVQSPSSSRSDSRKNITSPPKASSASRSSSCSSRSSSSVSDQAAPPTASSSSKTPSSSKTSSNSKAGSSSKVTSSTSSSKLPVQQSGSRKSNFPSLAESSSSLGLRLLRSNSSSGPNATKSPSPSSATSHSVHSPSRSPSINWSALLNMTRGLEEELGQVRSSTSPESLPSKSSASSHRNKRATCSIDNSKRLASSQSDAMGKMSRSSSGLNRSHSRPAQLNIGRGLDEETGEVRSSTSPESLPSKSSASSHRNKRTTGSFDNNKRLMSSPSEAVGNMSRSSSGINRSHSRLALKQAASSGSLPPRRSSNAASRSSNIPSRNPSNRSVARSCSTSTDSSSTESDVQVAQPAISSKRNSIEATNSNGGAESSFAAKIASSFGWLRKQNSEIIPWWLPSTENIPAMEDQGATVEPAAVKQQEETTSNSTSSADETQSSAASSEEESTGSNKPAEQADQADTDVEVEDLPSDQAGKLQAASELGDRSSPDGFEWPVSPSPPPPIRRNYQPVAYRPPSPYDNVDTPPMNTSWGLDALRALESSSSGIVVEVSQPHPADEESDESQSEEKEVEGRDQEEDEEEVEEEEETKDAELSSAVPAETATETEPATAVAEEAGSQLEDATFQIYKDGDYANYLDMEASLNEQTEELEGFLENRKNSIVLRTQLSVRVHAIIDKLLHSEGRELRRALFSLKQIFQEDKDLVHEFVQNDGLACLIRVGLAADQNYQNYILRALGQVMLYVDGMNGVMEHNPTVQWLYSLITSKYRLVAKTALKLLLVFVEYVKSNCQLLIKAIETVDAGQDTKPWCSVIRLLQERDSSDPELLIYAVTLINKTLNGLSDQQDAYYDQIEFLEAQGMQQIVSRFVSRPGTDTELLQQLELYELEVKQDDDQSLFTSSSYSKQHRRRTHRRSPRPSSQSTNQQANKRLNSFQLLQAVTGEPEENGGFSSGAEEYDSTRKLIATSQSKKHLALLANELAADKSFNQWSSSSSESSSPLEDVKLHMLNGSQTQGSTEVGVTPALRRRRERAERQRSLLREQEEAAPRVASPVQSAEDENESLAEENRRNSERSLNVQPISERISNLQKEKDKDNVDRNLLDISREASVKDLTERLQANHISVNSPTSPTDDKLTRGLGDLSGIISKAKEELTKSKSRHDLRNLAGDQQQSVSAASNSSGGKPESKKSENELHWESLLETLDRPLQICDLDFTDLGAEEDSDPLNPIRTNGLGPPPPPPPPQGGLLPPPMPGLVMAPPPMPPPSTNKLSHPASFFGVQLHHSKAASPTNSEQAPSVASKKSKKTVKLFWREIREDHMSLIKGPTLWDELKPVSVDTQKLEHLFESRSKDLITKKQQESAKNKELIVLDPKRSNSINIGMTKLPPSRTIKTAIIKMDSTIINREGIEKLLTMLPTEEERVKIQEAQLVNPDLPLGSAEQFLLSLASITELPARLKLWLFKSDYENMEKEVAEPLMDLKQGVEILQSNPTFRAILATLLAVGNFLNGAEIKGFQVDYLAKVPEVKDTVHKHSLLHHLCHMIMEQNPETTDLYSEIGAVTRASRVDFDELAANLSKMEEDCKYSWDYLRAIAKHDGNTPMKMKMSEFLTDCAERIMVANIVHRRVMNRFRKFLLWLGTPPAAVRDTKPGTFCRIVSEFALEYRTTRDRVLQQLEKKANHRERNKTRGKMITQINNGYSSLGYDYSSGYQSKEDRADAELRQLLGSDLSDTESMRTGTWGRSRKPGLGRNTSIRDDYLTDTVTDGDDEILESLVKTATRTPAPRERKRSNRQHSTQAERSSALKRSRTRDNNVFQPLLEESRQ